MKYLDLVMALRKRSSLLGCVPDVIAVPARGGRRQTAALDIGDATLDDIAFAIQAVEIEYASIGDRLFGLRKLYELARKAGALGAERAVPAVLGMQETR